MSEPTTAKYIDEAIAYGEIGEHEKPVALEGAEGFPLNWLSDRQFECLLYDMFKKRIERGAADGKFDRVLLMQGVGERGRDCALLLKEQHAGLIQCKRYDQPLTKPDVAREIIKFCLHAIKDRALLPNPKDFTYYFAASSGFNEKATLLLGSFNTSILDEPELEQWTKTVIGENAKLKDLDYAAIKGDLHKMLGHMKVEPLHGNDINTELARQGDLIQRYFAVKKVVSEEAVGDLKQLIGKIHKQVTDEDVKRLTEKLVEYGGDRRADFGLVSLWGYPQAFLDAMFRDKQMQPIFMQLAGAKSALDGLFLSYLEQRIWDVAQNVVTPRKDISPFTKQAAPPYLFSRLLGQSSVRLLGRLGARAVGTLGDIDEIKERLLRTGEAVLRDEFSEFTGDSGLRAFKIRVAKWTHKDFQSVDEMRATFDKEWPVMQPLLAEAEKQLSSLLPDNPVVVLRGGEWLDDEEHLKAIAANLKAVDERNKEEK